MEDTVIDVLEADDISETPDAVCEIIKARDEDKMASLVLDSIPGGESSDAINFLQNVIAKINSAQKKARISADTSGSKTDSRNTNSKEQSPSFFMNDNVDHSIITLALQFPDETYFTAYVIGLRGQVVLNIGKRTGTRIKVENEGVRGNDNLRHIFIMGPLKGTIRAYQMLQEHLCIKASEFPRGTTEFTHMIIPNEIVSHIIGKGGRFIKELQTAAKVERIELQKDRDIFEQYAGFYGRYAHIAGDFPCRLHAVYLLLRHLAQDVDLPAPFFGDLLPVQYPRGHGPNNMGHGNGNGHGNGYGHHNGQGGQFNDHHHMEHNMGNGGGHGYGSGMNDHNMGNYDQFNGNHMGPNHRDGGGGGGGHFGSGRMGPGPGHMGMGSDQSRGDRGFGGQQFGGPGNMGGGGGGGGFNGMPSVDVEVQVPSDKACVAFIYGPKGSAIIDMEQQSRCRIVFDKEPIKGSIEEKRQERKVTITGATALLTHRAVELVNARILEWKASFSNNNGHIDDGTNGSSLKRSRNDTITTATTSTNAASSLSTNTGYQNYPVNHNQNMTQNLIGPQPQQQHQQQQLQLQQQQLQLQQQYQQLQQQQYGMTPHAQTGQIATSTPGSATQQHQPSLLEQQYNQAFALFTQMQGAAQQQAQLADSKQGMSAGQVQGHGQYAQQQYPQAHPGR